MKFKEDKKKFQLKLKGKTAVFVDWANVFHWKDKLKKEVDPKKLFEYLKTYKQIKEIRFYYGTDRTHPASGEFLKKIQRMGYYLITKTVKFMKVYDESEGKYIWIRKCDFDLEIGLDCFERLGKFDSFVFFSGDGDFAALLRKIDKIEEASNSNFCPRAFGKRSLGNKARDF